MDKEYKGYNGTLILNDRGIVIKRGMKGFLLGGGRIRGDKSIPHSSIIAVQFKKAGLTAGYIQFTLVGGSEAKDGLLQSVTDENTVSFQAFGKNNELFLEAKNFIEEKIHQVSSNITTASGAEELSKYASLKESGVITEEEFQAKKKQLLRL